MHLLPASCASQVLPPFPGHLSLWIMMLTLSLAGSGQWQFSLSVSPELFSSRSPCPSPWSCYAFMWHWHHQRPTCGNKCSKSLLTLFAHFQRCFSAYGDSPASHGCNSWVIVHLHLKGKRDGWCIQVHKMGSRSCHIAQCSQEHQCSRHCAAAGYLEEFLLSRVGSCQCLSQRKTWIEGDNTHQRHV